MLNKYIATILFFLIIFFTSSGYTEKQKLCSPDSVKSNGYNIILIDITSLRADHLSCYGYFRKTSPYIDRLAEEGIRFEQAISQAYWTLPSVASIFSSKYVPAHQVVTRNQKLNDSYITLAEVLKGYGYKTAAFVGGLDLDTVHNLNQGFDVYSHETENKPMGSLAEIFPRAISWLQKNKDMNFFLFIQSYDVHPPFHYPQPYENLFDLNYDGIINKMNLDYEFLKKIDNNKLVLDNNKMGLSKKDINHIIAHYDGGITYTDKLLGEFMEMLKELNLINKSIIFLFSDHGEELSDHGSFNRFEKANLYEEVIHVPLIIKHPHIKGVKIKQQVQLIDVMPTILTFLDLPLVKEMEGRNLLPLIKDEANPDFNKYVYSGGYKKQMIRTKQWKLIFNGEDFELYNLKKDPKELNNVLKQNPKISADLAKKLFHWHITTRPIGKSEQIKLSRDKLPEFSSHKYTAPCFDE